MDTIRIHDIEEGVGVLAVDLRHVLDVLGARAKVAQWVVSDVGDEHLMVVGGEAADRLEVLATSGARIKGKDLAELADRVDQVIWGEFRAYDEAESKPWVIVRAIDSSWYEVTSGDKGVIARIASAFKDTRMA